MDGLTCNGAEDKLSHCMFGESGTGWEDIMEPCTQAAVLCSGRYYNKLYKKIKCWRKFLCND